MLRVVVFAAATLAKAWEPLSVAYAAPDQGTSFTCLLILCEALKLIGTLPVLAALAHAHEVRWVLSRESFVGFGVPAAFLALTNHMLGFAVPRLDALLYQVLFKSLSIILTALLSMLVLRQRLHPVQWGAIALLLLGSLLCEGGGEPPPSHPVRVASHRMGLAAVVVGACSFALQAVWFERAVAAAAASHEPAETPPPPARTRACLSAAQRHQAMHTVRQAAAFAWWGLLVNSLAHVAIDAPQWVERRRAAFPLPTPRGWVAALSIAAADVSMAVFLALLGSNAYSFSRVLALLVSSVIAATLLQQMLTLTFASGATLVAVSGWVYREPGLALRCFEWAFPCAARLREARSPAKTGESEILLTGSKG
ncbi:hypothetical protein AB1Y20_018368 [Prymnesium parvum]|uniref:Uncharacterized protein n=1 Tax=Prymnesium parvum TaxID=97485 RepID=A0AB34JNI6_PRYPA